jgi:hypothetical protein
MSEALDVVTVVLEGGPATLHPELRTQQIANPPDVIKICIGSGYEHFARVPDGNGAGPVIFRWTGRTRIAE